MDRLGGLSQVKTKNPMSTLTLRQELAHMADVLMDIQVQLDSRLMKLSEVLELRDGVVLPLTKPAGEPLDVLVGGALLGSGEIVVFNENFGVRITSFATGS
jgi:flagellar motor switch protein FliN/FliY